MKGSANNYFQVYKLKHECIEEEFRMNIMCSFSNQRVGMGREGDKFEAVHIRM